MTKELIIYCDESHQQGPYFSNFYGGALVRSNHIELVKYRLEKTKRSLNLYGEIKWSKITSNYCKKYISVMKEFFDLIKKDIVKIRIMFTHNIYIPKTLSDYHEEHAYFLLYYQFIKHAFGLKFADFSFQEKTQIRIYLDQLPDTKEKCALFKMHLKSLNLNKNFRKNHLHFNEENITDINSHDHVILQCVDIVLGAMQFRLNEHHRKTLNTNLIRGKRTIAKEEVYKFINKCICEMHKNFNAGTTTGVYGDITNLWEHSYRHWLFIPANAKKDNSKSKRQAKNNPASIRL